MTQTTFAVIMAVIIVTLTAWGLRLMRRIERDLNQDDDEPRRG